MDQNADPLRAPARTAAVLPGDIADRGHAETLPQPAADASGGLGVLVNNAGVQRFSERLRDLPDEQMVATFTTTVFAMVRIARAALPPLPGRR